MVVVLKKLLVEVAFGVVSIALYAAIITAAFEKPTIVAGVGALMLLNLHAFRHFRRVLSSGVLGGGEVSERRPSG